jgi:hypothetical protein
MVAEKTESKGAGGRRSGHERHGLLRRPTSRYYTDEVLRSGIGDDADRLAALKDKGVI